MAAHGLLSSPYLEGPYAPVTDETTTDLVVVDGALPKDLEGTFVRNGANPRYAPKGRYHWFDGDGMLHAVSFADGKARYTNRFVRTPDFLEEEKAGESTFTGILEPPRGRFKNTANTDVVFHAGKLLALWWQTGKPARIDPKTLATLGEEPLKISAHPKVDPRTNEMMFIAFGPRPPYLSYGVIDAKGDVVHQTAIESVPGVRYQHDFAITERYSILFDLPMYPDPEAMAQGKTRVRFDRDKPSRIGVIPRRGRDADITWFEAAPCYVYHTINAWEEGDDVVLVGCRINDPLVGDPGNPQREQAIPAIALQRLEPYLHEWRMNMVTGKLTERRLGDMLTEFPRMDNRRLGVKSRYSFNPRIAHQPTLVFEGLAKHDFETGSSNLHLYPAGWSGGEAVVCPRTGSTGEDDAYVMTFGLEHASGKSELWIWSARDFGAPIARLAVPTKVPAGYHAWWIPA